MGEAGITKAVVEAVVDAETAEAIINLGEVALDSVLDESLIRDIPIAGTLAAFARLGFGIRERLFIRKLGDFLMCLSDISLTDRAEFVNRIDSEAGFEERVGTTLVLLLERLDDLEKPRLVGKAFRAFVVGKITHEEFLRIGAAIDRAWLPDIYHLRDCQTKQDLKAEWTLPLAAAGIVHVVHIDSGGVLDPGTSRISSVGEKLLEVCFDGS